MKLAAAIAVAGTIESPTAMHVIPSTLDRNLVEHVIKSVMKVID